jgi:hypothetical protein
VLTLDGGAGRTAWDGDMASCFVIGISRMRPTLSSKSSSMATSGNPAGFSDIALVCSGMNDRSCNTGGGVDSHSRRSNPETRSVVVWHGGGAMFVPDCSSSLNVRTSSPKILRDTFDCVTRISPTSEELFTGAQTFPIAPDELR